jgi:hypothetical protein
MTDSGLFTRRRLLTLVLASALRWCSTPLRRG